MKLKNFINLSILFLCVNISPLSLDKACKKFAYTMNCSAKDITHAFEAIKLDFKVANVLNVIQSDSFQACAFDNKNPIESEILKSIDAKRNSQEGDFTKVNVDDLKEHVKFKLLYQQYLKKGKNALFYYNPLLDDSIILNVSDSYIVFIYLKFSSYYDDTNSYGFIKKIYLQYFVYERSTGKTKSY